MRVEYRIVEGGERKPTGWMARREGEDGAWEVRTPVGVPEWVMEDLPERGVTPEAEVLLKLVREADNHNRSLDIKDYDTHCWRVEDRCDNATRTGGRCPTLVVVRPGGRPMNRIAVASGGWREHEEGTLEGATLREQLVSYLRQKNERLGEGW